MEINERWLMDTVGWPVFKEGRQIYRGGAVSEVEWNPKTGLLRGTLVSGRTPRVAGMQILAKTDVENLCRCPQSQREGAICGHSAAVVFAWIEEGDFAADRPDATPSTEALDSTSSKPKGAPHATGSLEQVVVAQVEENFIKIWDKGKFPLRFSLRSLKDLGCPADSLMPEILAAGARFSSWLARNGIDAQSPPPFAVLDPSTAIDFLSSVADYPWLLVGDSGLALTVASNPIRPTLTLLPSDQVDEYGEPWIQLAASQLPAGGSETEVSLLIASDDSSGENYGYVYDAGESRLLPLPSGGELIAELLYGTDEVWRPMRWLVENLDELNEKFRVDAEALGEPIRLLTAMPQFELALEGSLNALSARLVAIYPRADENGQPDELRIVVSGAGLEANDEQAFPLRDAQRTATYWRRNLARESTVSQRLTEVGFQAADDRGRGRWILQGRDSVLAFFGSKMAGLREVGVAVILGEKLLHVTRGLQRIAPRIENFSDTVSGESWFECEFGFAGPSGVTLKESEIRRLLSSGQREVKLAQTAATDESLPSQSDGVGVVDADAVEEWREMLHDLDAQQVSPGKYRIQRHHLGYLQATAEGGEKRENISQDTLIQSIEGLYSILRAYQLEGVGWLCERLLTEGLGGAVLADEMGLGKTLQALAALRVLRNLDPRRFIEQPALVVAPTSLLANWKAEVERFVPELKVVIYHGARRKEEFAGLRENDLIITSYGVVTRDAQEFRDASLKFGLVVLDEASFVRNAKTKAAKAVRKIEADARLALTGTPVENSVRDLWSIVDFVLPGCLGTHEEFRQRYELPLAGDSAPDKLMARLNRRVSPHLLRRTKRAVVQDLPEKIEQVRYCELAATQRSMYTQMVDASRKTVREALKKGSSSGAGANQARMIALTALLRLRQICCDPRLLGKDEGQQKFGAADSAKMELLRDTIREAKEGGHRVLIFSQFVAMLKLIADQLDADGCKYARLDGSSSTTQRNRAVKEFQGDDTISVFLISLKAGGYGLNLTAADTVIHFDPWWNPAVEAQATDRAHRIGQERPVTSMKFICRGTVEEKILQLQQRKTAAFAGTIDENAPMMSGLSAEEVREVLDL